MYVSHTQLSCARTSHPHAHLLTNELNPTNIFIDIFQRLTANGAQGGVYQNIRQNTNNNSPVTDLSSTDLRCNVGGGSGASTSTVSVAAGSSLTFTADIAVYHQGPVSLYVPPFLVQLVPSARSNPSTAI